MIILLLCVVASATAACCNWITMCITLLLWMSFKFDLDIALVGEDKNIFFCESSVKSGYDLHKSYELYC